MGWGMLQGLGRGLERASVEPQQYYENTRKSMMENSALESAALQRALQMAAGMQSAEKHPLEVDSLRSILESQALQRKALGFGMAKDIVGIHEGRETPLPQSAMDVLGTQNLQGLVGPDGRIDYRPLDRQRLEQGIATDAAQAEAARSGAAAQWLNAQTNAKEADYRKPYYDAQAARFNAEVDAIKQGQRWGGGGGPEDAMKAARQHPMVSALETRLQNTHPMDPSRPALIAELNAAIDTALREQMLLSGKDPNTISKTMELIALQRALVPGAGGRVMDRSSGAPAPAPTASPSGLR